MVKSTIYKGIEFVRVSSLSKSEQEVFDKNFNRNVMIKILIGEEILHDCIQYKDYVLWYTSSFGENVSEKEVLKNVAVSEPELIEAD